MAKWSYPWEEWKPPEDFTAWEERVPEQPGERTPASFAERWARLTPRQRQVARLAALGETNREIGQRLNIDSKTVESHLFWVYCRLQVRNRRELTDSMWRDGPFLR